MNQVTGFIAYNSLCDYDDIECHDSITTIYLKGINCIGEAMQGANDRFGSGNYSLYSYTNEFDPNTYKRHI